MEEEKREHNIEHNSHEHHKKNNFTEKFRENPWMLSTFVCGALVVILLISFFYNGITGKVISANDAGEKVLNYFQEQGYEGLILDSVKEVSGLYEVSLTYEDQTNLFYITKDGKSFTGSSALIPTGDVVSEEETTTAEVPKSDKPTVELYVFTYCPYGTQMEKAMIPAVKLLGDKIDFKIRQIGAMHGEYEKIEAERQLCIEKNYPDNFLDYVLAFAESSEIGSCSGDATCLTPKLNALYTKLGISASVVNSCMTSEGEKLYNSEVSNADDKGVSGSPTLLINGVSAQSSRSPEGVKGAICEAFNNVPTECNQALSTSQASAGFGTGTSSSSSSASC